jgi:predicted RNA-binding protein with RPS1 domain
MSVPKDKIREIIGTGGKVIREIVATTGAKVDIDDEGVIKISSSDVAQIEAARQWIHGIVAEPEPGTIYTGKVANIVDFGAFVTFMPGKDGLVHVSEIKNERVENVRDVLTEGQEVKVKLLEVDQRGKVRLSMRVVDQETGAELEDTRPRASRVKAVTVVQEATVTVVPAVMVVAAAATVARAAMAVAVMAAAVVTVARVAKAATIVAVKTAATAAPAASAKAATTKAPRPSSPQPSSTATTISLFPGVPRGPVLNTKAPQQCGAFF